MQGRSIGILMFLPVPLVLWLITMLPLGPAWSLSLGLLIMLTHRLYARPYALQRARRRCLWCGGAVGDRDAVAIEVREPGGAVTWQACGGLHATRLQNVLNWMSRHKLLVRVGIGLSLIAYLVGAVLAAAGKTGSVTTGDLSAAFRFAVAVTVLPTGWLGPRSGRQVADALQVPFPLHIQALIGTAAVMALFRWIGLVWLIVSCAWFLTR